MSSFMDDMLNQIYQNVINSEKTTAKSSVFNEPLIQETDFLGNLAKLESIYWGSVSAGFSAYGCVGETDSSPVFKAIEQNHIDFLRQYFSNPSVDTEVTLNNAPGLTPLVYACILFGPPDFETIKKLDIIKFLISKGANVNSRCGSFGVLFPAITNVTALYVAIKNRNLPLISLLMDNGADPRVPIYPYKITPLHQAAHQNLPEICGRLVELGADINSQDSDGNTPLIIACASRSCRAAKLLIKKKSDVNITNGRNATALHAAVFGSGSETVHLLLRCGSNVHAKTIEGHTPLDMAIFMKRKKVKRLIIQANGSSSVVMRSRTPDCLQSYLVPSFGGATPLHVASLTNYIDDVRYFLDRGDNVNVTDGVGQTPLFFAVMCGSVKIVELLVKSGADPNIVSFYGLTAIHTAAFSGFIQIYRTLVNNGAIIDTLPHHRWSLLISAAVTFQPFSESIFVRKTKIAEMLIKQGAAFDEKFEGRPPFQHAADHENIPMVTLLQRQSELFQLIKAHNLTQLKKCIASGAILDCRSVKLGTPLQFAVVRNSLDIVAILIESGADVNFAPAGRTTALHYAAKFNYAAIVRHLLMSGAAFDVQTAKSGKTPLAICLDNNAKDCETAVLLKTVKAMFERGSASDMIESNENRDLVVKVRNSKGQSVDDVQRAKD